MPLTTEQFIERSKQIHGSLYDYSLTIYRSAFVKVIIICPIHGQFEQEAKSHQRGCGCITCAREKVIGPGSSRFTGLAAFLEKARLAHGEAYDYSQSDYKGTRKAVTIICPVHGSFLQAPASHIRGQKCPSCAKAGRPATTQAEFVAKAALVHSGKYDYDLAIYSGALSRVDIKCPAHGLFSQTPGAHLSGQGCPTCREERMRLDWVGLAAGRVASLYFLRIFGNGEEFYKVGITSRSVAKRYSGQDMGGYSYEVLACYKSTNVVSVYDWEQSILETFASIAYRPRHYFAGEGECFSSCEEILACFPI